MPALVLVELTMAFIVLCADSLPDGPARRPAERLLRSVMWPVTVVRWFTHRNFPKLGRFAAIVWLLTTIGWLVSLEYDRTGAGRMMLFVVVAEVTMAFVVWCVDAMSTDIHNRPLRRLVRSVFWVKAITDYMRDEDNIKIAHASLTVWILLTTGWLLSLGTDRILRPLGLQP
jgi:hypothetical protein